MDNATNEWDNEMNDLLAMAREQLEILHGEIFDRNVEHKVIDKCDTLIDILKEIKIKREDMDAIIDVKKLLVSWGEVSWGETRIVWVALLAEEPPVEDPK